jgi:hypothetical protein
MKMLPIRIRIRLAIFMAIQIWVCVSDCHQNNADPNADPSKRFAYFGKHGQICFYIHSNDRLYYISFHINGKCVRILSFLDKILKFSWKSK